MQGFGSACKRAGSIDGVEYLENFKGKVHGEE